MSKKKVALSEELLALAKDIPPRENNFVDGGLVKSSPPKTWEEAVGMARDQIYTAPTFFPNKGVLLGATELKNGKTQLVGVWLITSTEWQTANDIVAWLDKLNIDLLPVVSPKIRAMLARRENGKLKYRHAPGAVAATEMEVETSRISNRAIRLLAAIETLIDNGITPDWDRLGERHASLHQSVKELQAAGKWPDDITPPPKTT